MYPPLRVLFFGMSGAYSALALRTLAQATQANDGASDLTIAAVVLPQVEGLSDAPFFGPPLRWTRWDAEAAQPQPSTLVRRHGIALPTLGASGGSGAAGAQATRTTRQVARELGLPLLEIASLRDPAVQAEVASLAPDAIVVACFPWRVPAAVLALPRLGMLNLHPSLLPVGRGPDPLFWAFRHGWRETGATIHQMTSGFDAGPILAQERVPIPDGISERALERACALVAGRLAARSLVALAQGAATPLPQDERAATYDPLPTLDDYRLDATRPACWAFNFCAGLLDRPEPVWVDLGADGAWRVLAPLGYDAEATLPRPWTLADGVLALRCAPGVIRARVAPLVLRLAPDPDAGLRGGAHQ